MAKRWENINKVIHHQGLSYIPEIICLKLINSYHDDPLARHFGINKTQKLIAKKYYLEILRCDVEAFMKGCNIYLTFKVVRHKPYGDF